jgi:hypothetical protein
MDERIFWAILLLAQNLRVQLIAVINASILFATFDIPEACKLVIFLALLLVFKIAADCPACCTACLSCPHTVANDAFPIAIAGHLISVIDTGIFSAACASRARIAPQTKVVVNLPFAPRFVLDLRTLRYR